MQDQDRFFLVSDRSCPKIDVGRPHQWNLLLSGVEVLVVLTSVIDVFVLGGPNSPLAWAMGSRQLAPRYYSLCQSAAASEVVKRRCSIL